MQNWLGTADSKNPTPVNQGVADKLFESSYSLLSALIKMAFNSSARDLAKACQNQLQRFFLWGDGFGARAGELHLTISRSERHSTYILSVLFEIARIVSHGTSIGHFST